MSRKITIPMSTHTAKELQAGEKLLLSGVMYTARDAAHKQMMTEYKQGQVLPVELNEIAIYYSGPAPNREGEIIGSCGPTTSGRMDAYAPWFMAQGQTVMIGKGLRNKAVIDAMQHYGAVYLTAIGGAGALLAESVREKECIAYEDLGAEAIYKLTVEDFPVIVTIDAAGENLYESGYKAYKKITS